MKVLVFAALVWRSIRTGSLSQWLIVLIVVSSLFDPTDSKEYIIRDSCGVRESCGLAEKGSIMAAAAAAAPSTRARRNPSAALDFVQKEFMAIDDAEKKKCVSVVEEASVQRMFQSIVLSST